MAVARAAMAAHTASMDLQIDSQLPALTQDQALTGWRREFCIELLGAGQARIFTRLVAASSHKAAELQNGVLFHRVGAAFGDLSSFLTLAAEPMRQLVESATRQQPRRDNLFAAVVYDHRAWERVMDALDQWQRRPHASARIVITPQGLRATPRQLSVLTRRSAHMQAAVAREVSARREAAVIAGQPGHH